MTSPQDRSWSSSLLSSTLSYDLDLVDVSSAISGQRRSDPCLWRKLNSTQSEFYVFQILFAVIISKEKHYKNWKAGLKFPAYPLRFQPIVLPSANGRNSSDILSDQPVVFPPRGSCQMSP